MTYREIFDLKFHKKMSTLELERTHPAEIGKIREVALLDLPHRTLKKLLRNDRRLEELLTLKKTLTINRGE